MSFSRSRWLRRWATALSSLAAVVGSSAIRVCRAARVSTAQRTSVLAVQVAERASPSISDISPMRWPGPSTLTVSGSVRLTVTASTVISPSITSAMKPSSPPLWPWRMMASPSAQRRSSM